MTVSINRYTSNGLGLYQFWSGEYKNYSNFIFIFSLTALPILSVVLLFKLINYKVFRIFDVATAVVTWFFFLYNASFIRG